MRDTKEDRCISSANFLDTRPPRLLLVRPRFDQQHVATIPYGGRSSDTIRKRLRPARNDHELPSRLDRCIEQFRVEGFRPPCEVQIIADDDDPRLARQIERLAPLRGDQKRTCEVGRRIEQMYPGLSYIELFCRSPREGWDAWGNQAQEGNRAEAAEEASR